MLDASSELPSISVVVPTLNQGSFIEQTITSILGQFYPKLELIIIDGGSTDNTHQIIEKYRHLISSYISEPDNGQSHAINKGFRLAKGDILAWLNSDDLYMPQAMHKIASAIGKSHKPKLVYGNCIILDDDNNTSYTRIAPSFDAEKLTYYDYVTQASTFWTRSLWEAVGEINETYQYALDWDWFIRASKVCSFMPVAECLSIYRLHAGHKTTSGKNKRAKEILQVVSNYATHDWIEVYQQAYDKLYSEQKLDEKHKRSTVSSKIRYRLSRLIWPDTTSRPTEPTPLELAIATLV